MNMLKNSFGQLFFVNLKMIFRNHGGIFWTLLMPGFIYTALSVLPIGRGVNPQFTYSNFVLPGIVAMTIMQGGLYGLAYWMTDLKARGVIKRLLVTPIKQWEVVLSVVASRIIITILQTIALTLLGVLVFQAQFFGNYLSVLILVLLGGGIFLLLGLIISGFATSYESAAPITSAIGLPFTFLGNIFFPVDGLPTVLRLVAKAMPITYLADGLRHAYLEAFSWQTVGKDILILFCWLVFMLALTTAVFRLKDD